MAKRKTKASDAAEQACKDHPTDDAAAEAQLRAFVETIRADKPKP